MQEEGISLGRKPITVRLRFWYLFFRSYKNNRLKSVYKAIKIICGGRCKLNP